MRPTTRRGQADTTSNNKSSGGVDMRREHTHHYLLTISWHVFPGLHTLGLSMLLAFRASTGLVAPFTESSTMSTLSVRVLEQQALYPVATTQLEGRLGRKEQDKSRWRRW
jgi:hypothetical protein